jgi:outer membrane protein
MVLLLLLPAAAFAQTAAPAAATKMAVIDLRAAITGNAEGKKAADQWTAEFTKKQAEFDKLQKEAQDLQNRLSTQNAALSEAARADLTRQLDQKNTQLERTNQDAQKELADLQQRLIAPIADTTNRVLQAYAKDNGFALVFDRASEFNSIVFADDVIDITTEIIRRVDAEMAKTAKP